MRIVFMGTPDFAVPCLKALKDSGHEIITVVTQPDRPKGRGHRLTPPPVKKAALEAGLRVWQPEKIKTPECVAELRQLSPDIIVVVAFGQLLSKEILEIPRYGCINVHASLLPKYRGAAPIHWAVINGESETGVTIMQMDVGLDTGDMILMGRVPVAPEDTTGTVHDKLAEMGAELLAKAINRIESGKAERVPQDNTSSSYAPLLTKEIEKIDWTRSSVEIFNLVRGLNPWPGAYTQLGDKILKIWGTQACTIDRIPGPIPEFSGHQPGEVLGIIPEVGFAVATGNGCLAVTDLQLQGNRRMKAADFVHGHNITKGVFLD
ncbi:methionyl-tRNA formyltransferase [Phosphitispora fastidiosa]|uniref:methionyl-tRNA formyltransferase n=1 Tax=Phosphitispora fastidiosa TaxID=2837202 RepID=UPI001E419159|nr:methionyl-tRNA formyltransferase [Phosphitispora fastidiosa]MBU7006614.1 methionyl-tRNA formyltransferase [Phosphitispora fastidiosa]